MADIKEYIYSPSGDALHEVSLTQNCKRKFSLMNEDSVTLAFSLAVPLAFPVGSRFRDFYITKAQNASYNATTGVYDYSLKFDAYYWLWANKVLRYASDTPDAPAETSFSLTASIALHATLISKALARLGLEYDGSPFGVNTSDTSITSEAKLIRYENSSILGGIQAIAEAFECEWWVSGNIIYFGRLQHANTPFVFEAGVNVSSISFSDSKESAPNRLYVFGSDRNLPPNYRDADSADTVGGVVNKRLLLPKGTPFLQTKPNIPEAEIVEKVIVLDDVYPRTVLAVNGTPETYSADAENEDGSSTTLTYYRIKPSDGFFFSSAYILPNEELKVRFTSGLLNGMEFGAHFNPKGVSEKIDGAWNSDAQLFEIVANEDYGRVLPDGILRPKSGDSFILIGWDSTKIAELGLVAAAEAELLAEGRKALVEQTKDLSSCSCPMAWDYIKPLLAANKHPKPGDAVIVKDSVHFGEGGRASRIIGFEHSLDIPYADMTYSVGENVSVSRLKNIESKLDGLAKSGESAYIQNSLDFLSKRRADSTPFRLSLLDGARFGDFLHSASGADIDKHGNAEVESLFVRSWMKVYELIYNRINAREGNTSFSDSGVIESYDPDSGFAVLRKRWDGDFTAFQKGDIVYGYVNNLANAEYAEYGKAWGWIRDVDREANCITIVPYADEDVPGHHNLSFAQGMVIARWGNVIAPEEGQRNDRQDSFYLSCDDGNIVELVGVDSPILRRDNYGTVLGHLPEGLIDEETAKYLNSGQPYLYARGIVVQDLVRIGYNGVSVKTPNFRGEWSADTAADPDAFYRSVSDAADVVGHAGALWQCVSSHASSDAPSDSNPDWIRLTSSNPAQWRIMPSVNVIYIRDGWRSENCLSCTVRRLAGDGTSDFSAPEQLDPYGLSLRFSLDGVSYSEFWVRAGDTVDDIELEDGDALVMGGNNVPWVEVLDNIWLSLVDADGAVMDSFVVPVVCDGASGESIKGDKGDDGKSLDAVLNLYLAGDSDSVPPSGEWVADSSLSGFSESLPFLWGKERLQWSEGADSFSSPHLIARWAKDGDPGRNVVAIEEYYLATENEGMTPAFNPDIWHKDETPADYGEEKPYLWNVEIVKFDKGPDIIGAPVLISHYGKDGRSLADVGNLYLAGESASIPPEGEWVIDSSLAGFSESKPYLWGKERISWSDGEDSFSSPHLIAMWAKEGQPGRNVTDIEERYLATAENSRPAYPSPDWVLDPSLSGFGEKKPWLWNVETVLFDKGDPIVGVPVLISHYGRDGEPGPKGDSTEVRFRVFDGYDLPDGYVFPYADRIPLGWALSHGEVLFGQSLWQTSAVIDGSDNLKSVWSDPVMITGRPGEPGEPGSEGKAGLMAYPAGVFDPLVTYVATDSATPVVMDGRDGLGLAQYFVLRRGKSFCGDSAPIGRKSPHEDQALGGEDASWDRMDRFNSIFADIVMAEFAKLASAVFSGDLMFSQQGVSDSGAFSEDYRNIGNGFSPNLMIDFLSGKLTANDAVIRGDVVATSGQIGNLRIEGNDLVGYSGDSEVIRIGVGSLPSLGAMFSSQRYPGSPMLSLKVPVGSHSIHDLRYQSVRSSLSLTQPLSADQICIPAVGFRCSGYGASGFKAVVSLELSVNGSLVRSLTKTIAPNESADFLFDGLAVKSGDSCVVSVGAVFPNDILDDSQSWSGGLRVDSDAAWFRTLSPSRQGVVFASDGIYASGSDGHFRYSASDGFEAVAGQFGIRVSPDGIKKRSGADWIPCNI